MTQVLTALGEKQSFFHSRIWRGKTYLVSPFWDIALAGGVALLYCLWVFVYLPEAESANKASVTNVRAMYAFAFFSYFVNYPHFMSSYGIMYQGFRKKLKQFYAESKWFYVRYVFAGIGVPLILLGVFAYGGAYRESHFLSWAVLSMYFFVGWHYAKQSFGVMMVLSAVRGVRFHVLERKLMYYNMYVVWFVSWLKAYKVFPGEGTGRMRVEDLSFSGMPMTVPDYVLTIGNQLVIGYLIAVLLMWAVKFVRGGERMPLAAIIGYLSVYILLFWGTYNPLWLVATPLFHSAQYLLFVYAIKGRINSEDVEQHDKAKRDVAVMARNLFIVVCMLTGLVGFELLPQHLNRWSAGTFWALPYLGLCTIFINVHHYFIDNVIWKRENKEVWQQLLRKPSHNSSL